ncbi:unnamed protein product [Bursaphelenchus xylophilus]|uniref:receptor protein-tyrosine kinase n=1 Tax=Bursaphelenchus xylophilus TaxID=6326 RepID=A0A1I7SAF7_BURXY|nr:unnamed protein product [Bursaphelenchus xylophilus]CAG9083951.1 unnamed protein product [Bursaphelenchus xylophilus]
MSTQIISVYLADGTFRNVKVDSFTTVQRILHVVLDGLGVDRLSFGHFALRLSTFPTGPGSTVSDIRWLHSSLRMPQIIQRYLNPLSSGSQMRFELRVRFIPSGLYEMYQTQLAAFLYLYDQLLSDYVLHVSWKISKEKAFNMAALAIRKRLKNLNSNNLEKRFDFASLESNGGLMSFLPESIIVGTPKKQLYKLLLNALKKVVKLSEIECVFQFMKNLMNIARFDSEIFKAFLGANNIRPVELYVGQHYGIAYKNENTKEPVVLAELRNVIDISVRRVDQKKDHFIIKIKISGNSSPLIITVTTSEMAESLAHLVDGYQMLLSQQASVWSARDLRDSFWTNGSHSGSPVTSPTMSPLAPRKGIVKSEVEEKAQIGADAKSLLKEIEIDPQRILLEKLLGSGQYGNVYQGLLQQDKRQTIVAVKVCKEPNSESQTANNVLLEEAYTMSQFWHPHIIHIIGVSIHSTVWVVMEMMQLGELRQYLKREKNRLTTATQLLFCKQIASALCYLHSKQFVHRDIAARNVLVANHRCVKLSDFGMSRLVEEDFYKSSCTKLPLKWLPLESLNYRRFNAKTDIYMLAVCFWEIFSFGEKPWSQIKNHDLSRHLEEGNKLECPEYCPIQMYHLMKVMWEVDSERRPLIKQVYGVICSIFKESAGRLFPGSAPNSPAVRMRKNGRDNSLRASLSSLTLYQNQGSSYSDIQDRKYSFENSMNRVDVEKDLVFSAVTDVLNSLKDLQDSKYSDSITILLNSTEKILFLLQELLVIIIPHLGLLDQPIKSKVDEAVDLLNDDCEVLKELIQIMTQEEDQQSINRHIDVISTLSRTLRSHTQGFWNTFHLARIRSNLPNV